MSTAQTPTQTQTPSRQRTHTDGQLRTRVAGLIETANGFEGLADRLHKALRLAGEAGREVETAISQMQIMQTELDAATETVGTDESDPVAVYDHVASAYQAATALCRGLAGTLGGQRVPKHIDTGVYDTVGGYAQYVQQFLSMIVDRSREWIAAVEKP